MRLLLVPLVLASCSVPAKIAVDGGPGSSAGSDGSLLPPGDGSAGDPPVITLTGQPPALGNQPTVTFSFEVNETAVVECRLDSDAYADCPPPDKTFATLADGSHTFDLRATANGLTGAIPSTSFAIDTAPPVVAITGEPAAASPVASGDFQFNLGDAQTATCAIDSAAAQACTSPYAYTGLADGSHTFTLNATDAAGNTATKTYTWTVQTQPPSLAITSEPPSLSATASGQFQFTTGSSVTVTCKIDSGTASACTSPYTYASLADGSHTFTLTGTDAASNVTTKQYTWTIDTTPPAMAIGSTPPALSRSTSASFSFTVGDATTVTCQLDGTTPGACTSPKSYTGLADGSHKFTLVGSDTAGNQTTKTYSWTVDTTPPTLAITSTTPTANPTNSKTMAIAFTTGDAATVTCQLDSGSPAACTSPASYMGLADGSHTFTLSGSDAAGNTATKSYSWSVDTTPPTLAITSVTPVANPTNLQTMTVAFTVGDSATYTCQLDNGTPNACASPYTYTGLAEGSHTFTLRGTDAVNNTAMASYTWNVDLTAPTVSISSYPTTYQTTRSASVSFTVSDGVTACKLDSGTWVSCTSPYAFTVSADGSHTINVGSTDTAGNFAYTSKSWVVDTLTPTVAFGTVDTTNCPSTVDIPWTRSDATSGIKSCTCSYTGVSAFDCTSSTRYTATVPLSGTDAFKISCTDNAGLTSPLKTQNVSAAICP
ncbi:MAG: Ig-like domain-containing protein [Acidobacteriota bacterium]